MWASRGAWLGRTGAWALVAAGVGAVGARGQGPPDYDFQWATIWDIGNPAYPGGPPYNGNAGRGSVSYPYRISKLEITTQQWADFLNMALRQGVDLDSLSLRASFWGVTRAGNHYVVNDPLRPVIGLTWRAGAYYCNWLNNGKQESWQSCLSGAYDTSTFGSINFGDPYTDQLTHSPGAKFWIPTLDEWMKAAYFDPNHSGPGQAGWWTYPYRSDSAPVPGAPGTGQTSAGWHPGGFGELLVDLGAYTTSTSAYGLWDLSGGSNEWLEEPLGFNSSSGLYTERRWFGSHAGDLAYVDRDYVQTVEFDSPVSEGFYGFRIAGAIFCPADVDENGFVNGDDADQFYAWFFWGDAGADLNHDGFVNGDDADEFAMAFDAGC